MQLKNICKFDQALQKRSKYYMILLFLGLQALQKAIKCVYRTIIRSWYQGESNLGT